MWEEGTCRLSVIKVRKESGKTDEHMKNWYKAVLMLQKTLDDPKNQYTSVMKKGTMVVFDSNHICHRNQGTHSPTQQ